MYLFSIWPSKCVCSSESRNLPRQLLSTKVMWHSYQKPPTDSLTICHPKTGDRRSVLTSLWFLEQQSCDFSPTHPLLPPGWKQIVLNMVFVWSTRTLGTDEQILLLGLTPWPSHCTGSLLTSYHNYTLFCLLCYLHENNKAFESPFFTKDFRKLLKREERPVLMMFYAPCECCSFHNIQ